jgi:hemoglobin-like flavoprotein
MNEKQVSLFQDSVARCLASPQFIRDFYDRFTGSSEAIRDKFKDTDFSRQMQALADSLYMMAVAVHGGPENLSRTGMKHLHVKHRTMGIEPAMYDTWLECLVDAARAHDLEFSSSVEKAWRACLAPGIKTVRDGTPFEA